VSLDITQIQRRIRTPTPPTLFSPHINKDDFRNRTEQLKAQSPSHCNLCTSRGDPLLDKLSPLKSNFAMFFDLIGEILNVINKQHCQYLTIPSLKQRLFFLGPYLQGTTQCTEGF